MGFASYLEDIREKLHNYSNRLQEYSERLDFVAGRQNACKQCELYDLDFLVRSIHNLLQITDEYLELLTNPDIELAAELHNAKNQCKMLSQRNLNLERRLKALEKENLALRSAIKKANGTTQKVVSRLQRWISENEQVLQNRTTQALLTFGSPPAVRLRELTSELKEFVQTLKNSLPQLPKPPV